MKNFGHILIISLLIAGVSACNNKSKNNKNFLFTSAGKTSEALVVIDNDLWKSSVGDTIKSYLSESEPWLVQSEPYFDLDHIPENIFKDLYTKYRNILIVKIRNDFEKSSMRVVNNVYAKPQTIIEIRSKNTSDFYDFFAENNKKINELFRKNELERLKNVFYGIRTDSLSTEIQKRFGFKMTFPRGYYLAADTAGFAWLRRVDADVEEGVFIYIKPYTDTMAFAVKNIIAHRDSITKAYIPGPVNGSYMKTSSVFPAYYENVDFKGNYSTLLRSWWDVEGYAMGGPFISYTFVDTISNKIITLDGYIKAPKKDKRDILLHLEAIFDSFEMK